MLEAMNMDSMQTVMRAALPALVAVATLVPSRVAIVAQETSATTEWHAWGGPHGTFVVDAPPLDESWPVSGPPQLWSRPLGAGHSAILVGDGRLYTMYRVAHGAGGSGPFEPSETVIAMDAETGNTLWEYTYPSKVQDFGQGAGPHSTPLLVDGRLFTIGTNKELHVFDPATGAILWSRNLVEDFNAPPLLIRSMVKPGYGVSPIAYQDTIIIQVGGPGQAVMALRQDDGSVVWKSGSFLVSHSPAGFIDVDGQRQLIVFAGQAVHGLNPDTGEILWAHPHDAGNDFNFQIPLWGDNVLFLSSGYIGGSRALRLTRDSGITNVEELWYNPRLRFTFLNPLRLGDFVYGTSGQSASAVLTATHVSTGETAWQARGFSRANMIYADGKALVLQEDGILSIVTLTPSGTTTLAEAQLFNTTAWTAPTLVGATLYARDRERIVALDLAPGED
jgi:outer membrane protein assembly factor BamB